MSCTKNSWASSFHPHSSKKQCENWALFLPLGLQWAHSYPKKPANCWHSFCFSFLPLTLRWKYSLLHLVKSGVQGTDIIVLWVIKSCISDSRSSCLLPDSLRSWQTIMVAFKKGKILDTSFLDYDVYSLVETSPVT